MEMTMVLRFIVVAALLSMVGACVAGPYEGRPAHYKGGYEGGYNAAYPRNNGYDRAYNGRYENGGYNRSYNYGPDYQ
jgi:hypothetical protein